jgi:DNA-binding transcriptional LysR family regulator
MDIESLAILVNAVSAGSISAAARRLGLAPVVASRRLGSLETELGVRLVNRTTRSLSLTPEGEAFLPYAREILETEASGRAALAPANTGASGLLRVTAPPALGRYIVIPMLAALLAGNPQLKVELHLTDRLVDIVAEGLDLAIRIADLKESNLITRRVGSLRRVVCAAPEYLAKRGRPVTVAELAKHDCLTLLGQTHWSFSTSAGVRKARVGGPFTCNTVDGLQEACRQAMGLSMQAAWSVAADVRAGRLVELDLDAAPYAPEIAALYPHAHTVAPKLRVFIDALVEALTPHA